MKTNLTTLIIAVASLLTALLTYLDHRQTAKKAEATAGFLNTQYSSNYVQEVEAANAMNQRSK